MPTPPLAGAPPQHGVRALLRRMRAHPLGRVTLITSALFVAGLASGVAMMWLGAKETNVDKLGLETAKFSVQLLLIAGGAGILVKEYERARSRRAAEDEFRRQLLRNVIRAYSDTKKLRRVLRARCTRLADAAGGEGVLAATYDEYMERLNTTQIELEVLIRELKVFRGAIEAHPALVRSLTGMEKYLGRLVDEYERERRGVGESVCRALTDLPRLAAFVARRPAGDFRPDFAAHFHAALSVLERERVRIG